MSYLNSQGDARLGRRLMCLTYCVAYTLSCLSTLYRSTAVLYGGRLLGGVSTSILYSCFESWMVTEFHSRGLAHGGALSRLFGVLTAANSVVAIAAGVSSEWLVGVTGTRESPFMAGCVLLAVAFVVMLVTWVGLELPPPFWISQGGGEGGSFSGLMGVDRTRIMVRNQAPPGVPYQGMHSLWFSTVCFLHSSAPDFIGHRKK